MSSVALSLGCPGRMNRPGALFSNCELHCAVVGVSCPSVNSPDSDHCPIHRDGVLQELSVSLKMENRPVKIARTITSTTMAIAATITRLIERSPFFILARLF